VDKYSKPLGNLLDFKQDYFQLDEARLKEFSRIAAMYRSQPKRDFCKNCAYPLDQGPSQSFSTHGVEHVFCLRCTHCNGAFEDTDAYCRALYVDDGGKSYSRSYSSADVQQYRDRVTEIYIPKAQFLREALDEAGATLPLRLTDYGAGAGYFVSAAIQRGFGDAVGFEPSMALVSHGNQMMGGSRLVQHDLSDTVSLIEACDTPVVSFIGVLEHLQAPRAVLEALSLNSRIQFIFFSVPLFSPSVVLESIFPSVVPRQLVGTHTHVYTERSIQYFCEEFGFERLSSWWFGLDMTDLSSNILRVLPRQHEQASPLATYWTERFMPLLDELQGVLDRGRCCSEVHMLLGRKA
jgi:hypothetical protein